MTTYLRIYHDGDLVAERDVSDLEAPERLSVLDELKRLYPPPFAKGSVISISREHLPRRHPKRETLLSTSGHGQTGPIWIPAP